MYKIIDGKEVSASVRNEIKAEVEALKNQGKKTGLAVVIVGNNPASRVYVNNKKKGCEEVGMESFVSCRYQNRLTRKKYLTQSYHIRMLMHFTL